MKTTLALARLLPFNTPLNMTRTFPIENLPEEAGQICVLISEGVLCRYDVVQLNQGARVAITQAQWEISLRPISCIARHKFIA